MKDVMVKTIKHFGHKGRRTSYFVYDEKGLLLNVKHTSKETWDYLKENKMFPLVIK